MMGLVGGLTEVDGRQEGENECLQERHKKFKAVHENHEYCGEDADAISRSQRIASLPKMRIKLTKDRMMMWPALMFAVKRIINTIGFRNIPTISIGMMMGITNRGTPGGQNKWPQ